MIRVAGEPDEMLDVTLGVGRDAPARARTALGGLNAYNTHSGTMMIGFPEWIIYAAMTPALALTAVIGLTQAVRGFQTGGAE